MAQRRSISIDGLSHLTAIPVASRIGPLLVSSVIAPFNPGTREVPETVEQQIANIFRHVDLMLTEAGGNWSHVAKMEFWGPEGSLRQALDVPWVEKFPDAASRPARHTHVGTAKTVSASFIAYLGE
ncbi:MAG: RidA family protein [Pseudomonadales bacterium]|nr:RidA family protein [Pseudomonadales bacterium]MCP5182593.1 RidA family protein [Pseudomonadales bacterium]